MVLPLYRIFSHIPLRTALIVPFIIEIVGTVAIVGYLSFNSGQQAVNDVATKLRSEVTARIQQHLKTFLAQPKTINQINSDAISLGLLNVENKQRLEGYFWQQIQRFDTVSYIHYSNEFGEFIGTGRLADRTLNLGIVEKSASGKFYNYETNNIGARGKLLSVTPNFDPRTLPWYKVAAQEGKAIWSPISVWVAPSPNISIDAGLPVYKSGKLVGVLGVALVLSDISEFLKEVKVGRLGQTFIIERSGYIVASSTAEKPFIVAADGKSSQRIHATNSKIPLISLTAKHLSKQFKNFNDISSDQQLDFKINDDLQFVQVTPFSDNRGIDWLIVVVVPQSSFMDKIYANTLITLIFCLLALAVSTIIGIVTVRWITQPIIEIGNAATALADGQFELTVATNRKDELGVLARTFNSMAAQLQTAFMNLHKTNQDNAELYLREQEKSQQLEQYLKELQQAQMQLVQSEKMSALGNLIAGVGHEINNPVGFIGGNLDQAIIVVEDLIHHLQLYQQKLPNPGEEIEEDADKIELNYILEDLPQILASMKNGVERIHNISISLRTFSRADTNSKVATNIHDGIDSTLTILQHRLKANNQRPAVQVIKNYGNIPRISCHLGQLNQVFMNLIANAIDALDAACVGRTYAQLQADPGQIIISSEMSIDLQTVSISIKDNGSGMSESVKSRIFDHLFTTKDVGKGTGLGLAIAKSIVEETHGGTLDVESALGLGTEFIIRIPTLAE
ncbi:ATP-binding protein [Microcoleus sp. herbarium12]|uniref:ATP-binding protein n=1 Tax=Microcoleus sp. herbarium12 TaxID=3055437 RepID=UPI002FD405E0